VVCVDELGPVSPRTFPPAPAWSPDGHRIKAPLEYSRGPDKVWVFGALRVEDGKSLTFTSRSRNSKSYLKLLKKIERAIPRGLIYLIADNLKIHDSALVRKWLEEHPRIEHAFIPKGAAWLNLIEGWWRVFRRQAFAKIKNLLRKAAARSKEALVEAIGVALSAVTVADVRGFFEHAGYRPAGHLL
jgi:transposase